MPVIPAPWLTETAVTLRGLRQQRLFTSIAVLLLALGIGLASAVFLLLWQAIYAQLPVPSPDRLVTFESNVAHNGRSDSDADAETFSEPTYRYLAAHMPKVTGVVARHGELVNIETPAGPEHLLADFVSTNFFDVLRVSPAVGRTVRTGHGEVILAYDFWQRAYAGQPSAWNSTLRINGLPFRIIGVAAPGFKGVIGGQAPRVFLNLSDYAELNPGWHSDNDWGVRWLNAFARLPENVTPAQAEAALQPVYRAAVRQELAAAGPQSPDYLRELSHEHLKLVPSAQGVRGILDEWNQPLKILQCMTVALLALTILNVAGLLLVRSLRRKQEILIRRALGAPVAAIMRLHFQETVLLSLAGGALALWIARTAARFLVYLAHMGQRDIFTYTPHGRALLLHWGAALLSGLLVGLLPAWQAARFDLSTGLSEGALTHSSTRVQVRLRRILAAAQISLSLVLVVVAGLFAQALHNLVSVPVGFNPNRLTVFSIDAKTAQSTLDSTTQLWNNLARELSHLPGVASVGYGTGGPFPQGEDVAVAIPTGGTEHASGMHNMISAGYFKTLNIPLVAGREFDARDRRNTPNAIILNETMAQRLFGKASPIGQTLTLLNGLDPNWQATVVGVIADHHQSWQRATAPLLYTPAEQARRVSDITYYVRTTSAAALPEATIRELVRHEAPGLGSYDIATMHSRMAEFAGTERALSILVSAFAAFALLVAGVGIYGVVSYSASLRTREFGVRLAVGATPARVAKLVLDEALVIFVLGLLISLPLAAAALLLIRHQLSSAAWSHPALYFAALLIVLLCTLAPALGPAARARRLSIQNALKTS